MTLHVCQRMAAKRYRCLLCGQRIKAGKLAGHKGVVGGAVYKYVRYHNRSYCFCRTHDDLTIINWVRSGLSRQQQSRLAPLPSPKAHRPLTVSEYIRIISLISQGVIHPSDIAQSLGRHHATINRLFDRAGIKPSCYRAKQSNAVDTFLSVLARCGVTTVNVCRLAKILEVHASTVSRRLPYYGLVSLGRGRPPRADRVINEATELYRVTQPDA